MPKFEMPKMEVPAAFREFAEKGVTQCKESWEKMKAVTEEATDLIETSYATAAKGYADYGSKVIEAARANTNAQFDYAGKLMTVKSLSEMVELSTAHMRSQYEALTAQTKELIGARAEGRDRDHRAAEGQRHQRVQEGRLSVKVRSPRRRKAPVPASIIPCDRARAVCPGFFASASLR